MERTPHDRIGSIFAQRRLNRRQSVQQGIASLAAVSLVATGLQAATAQEASPSAEIPGINPSTDKTEFLFVQSFESGSIAPGDGAEDTYTLTLVHGLGQTLYFSDRPERIVGAAPTQHFLDGLGFSTDNPPNAALVVDTGDGGTDIAVVELTNPTYDPATATATYDISVLANYETDTSLQLQQAPADLATMAAEFGSAHLFIDDCADLRVLCQRWKDGTYDESEGFQVLGLRGFCWDLGSFTCLPCDHHLADQCYLQFPEYCNQDKDCNIRY